MDLELNLVNDEGLKFLIEENSAKIRRLKEQNERLRQELLDRFNKEKGNN